MDLCILNDGSSTYIHPATGSTSALDLSICGPSLVLDYKWNKNEDLCGSDHFPMIQTSNAVEEPGIPSESQKGIASAREGLHSLIKLSGIWASLSESVAVSSSHPRFFRFVLWVPCYVSFGFVTYCTPQSPSPTRGCTQAVLQQVYTRAQNAIYLGDLKKEEVYFYPLIYPKPLPSNQN